MRRSTAYAEALAPVARCMLDEARIVPGTRVLDVGSGNGDMALLAAEATGPSGLVLATDVSLAKMAGLAPRIDESRLHHTIRMLGTAAEELTLEAGSFDVALARNCVMYFEDPGRALRNIRRALRPGGRLVASVYGPLVREPFHSIPIEAVERLQTLSAPLPDYLQAFRFDVENALAAFAEAGFTAVGTRTVPVQRTYSSLASALESMRASPSLLELLSVVPPDRRNGAWADIERGFRRYEGPTGLCIPGEQVVIVGTA
jgi:SAM-dependent methyltransferase